GELRPYQRPGASALLDQIRPADGKAAEIIDGGYFENEGLQTALELADWLRVYGPPLLGNRFVYPIIVQATGDGEAKVTVDDIVRCNNRDKTDNPARNELTQRPLQLLAPLLGLYNVRGGHSAVLLREARDGYCGLNTGNA